MKLKVIAVSMAAVGALALTACGGSSTASPNAGSTEASGENGLRTISIGMVPVVENAPLLIGIEKGIFEDHGINLEPKVIQSAASMVPSMMNGQLDLGSTTIPPFLTARSQKLPVQLVAGISTVQTAGEKDTTNVVITEASSLERPRDLEGKTVAVNALNGGPHIGMVKTIENDGGDPTKVKFVVLAFADMQAALEAGQIDAAALAEPFVTKALQANHKLYFSNYIEDGIGFVDPSTTSVAAFATEQYLGANADLMMDFQEAMSEATALAAAEPQLVRDVMVEHGRLDASLAQEIRLSGYGADIDLSVLEDFAAAMEELGAIEDREAVVDGAVWSKP